MNLSSKSYFHNTTYNMLNTPTKNTVTLDFQLGKNINLFTAECYFSELVGTLIVEQYENMATET